MLRKCTLIALVAIATGPAFAALTWNFDDGMQGWTIVNTPAGTNTTVGKWVAPGEQIQLASDTLGNPIYSTAPGGNVYLPGDGNGKPAAIYDLTSKLKNGKTQSFMLQADVWLPNLRPLNFRNNYPGITDQNSGIAAYGINGTTNSDWGVTMGGDLAQGGLFYKDYTSDAWTRHLKSWCLEDKNAAPTYDSMWNCWIKLKMDWNYSEPGKVIASAFIPFDNYVGNANQWITVWSGPIESSTWYLRPLNVNRIGIGSFLKGDGPWSKSQIDNVIFDSPDLIPEPATLMLLGLGGLALLRRRHA
jgi:hypothetical protein